MGISPRHRLFDQMAEVPPSTYNSTPFTKLESSDARNSATVAISSGCPISPRDIARRADVGLATLLRHFPMRESLFDALLRENLDALTQKARDLEASNPPDEALVSWFGEGVAFVQSYSGVVALMASAHEDPESALYASCSAVRESGARLLSRAQAAFAPRGDYLLALMTSAILTK